MEQEIICQYCGYECTVVCDDEFDSVKIEYCPACGEQFDQELDFDEE